MIYDHVESTTLKKGRVYKLSVSCSSLLSCSSISIQYEFTPQPTERTSEPITKRFMLKFVPEITDNHFTILHKSSSCDNVKLELYLLTAIFLI